MITVSEALDHLFALARPLGAETVPLLQASGRILAVDLQATRDQPPFAATRDANGRITAVNINPPDGIAGQIVRQIEPGVDMVVNVPGDAALSDAFTTLVDLRDALLADPYSQPDVSDKLSDLKDQQDTVLDIQAAVGTKMRRLDSAVDRMENNELGMRELLSKAEDADMAEVVTELQQQQYIYQTALAVNGQVLRTSLLDFIR